jgi:hypothetical protein
VTRSDPSCMPRQEAAEVSRVEREIRRANEKQFGFNVEIAKVSALIWILIR